MDVVWGLWRWVSITVVSLDGYLQIFHTHTHVNTQVFRILDLNPHKLRIFGDAVGWVGV